MQKLSYYRFLILQLEKNPQTLYLKSDVYSFAILMIEMMTHKTVQDNVPSVRMLMYLFPLLHLSYPILYSTLLTH